MPASSTSTLGRLIGFTPRRRRRSSAPPSRSSQLSARRRNPDEHRRDTAERPADSLSPMGGLPVVAVCDRSVRGRCPVARDDRRGSRAHLLRALLADGRRGADHDEVLRLGGRLYGSEEEATFLSTQQVDEARHMQFYARFQDEVISGPAAIAVHIERARESVSDAFRHIFDEELVEAHRRLVAEPRSLAAKVRFITLYHLILEGTLGLTTFKFTTDYLIGEGLLPGFVEGYSKMHQDETRHIGYGVGFLRESVRLQPEMGDVVRQTLLDLLRSLAASLAPPDTGSDRDFAAIGASSEDIRAFALGGLTRRLEIIGVPLASL